MMTKLRGALSCVAATAADFVVLTALVQLGDMAVLYATAASATTGAVINYFLHRHLVFNATGQRKRKQMPRYLFVAGTTMVLSASLTALIASAWIGAHYLLARAIAAIVVYLLWHEPLARRVFRRGIEHGKRVEDNGATEPRGGVVMQHEDRIELSVVIPAFNEAERIPLALTNILRVLHERELRAEVIVVDDGSIDITERAALAFREQLPELRVIRYERNRGKGFAVKTGVLAARGEFILFMDADNSVSLDNMDLLLEPLRRGADAAIGSRYIDPRSVTYQQPWFRVAWSRLANWVVQRALVDGIVDTQCGFKAFRAGPAKEIFPKLTIERWGFDMEVLTLLRRRGYSILEVPVPFHDDRRTRINPWSDLWGVVRDFLYIRRNLALGVYEG